MRGLKSERLDEMESFIIDRKNVSIKELSRSFGVSINTVRKDIENILQRGKVKKVYGGVSVISNDDSLLEYSIREDKYKTLKRQLCTKAEKFIEDGDIIFLDSGTTTIYMTDYLKDKKNIKVVTNNIVVINRLMQFDNIQVIGIGGKVNNKTKSFASVESLKVLDSYNIRKAFMAVSALSIKNGAMNSSFDEKNIKSMVVNKAEHVYILCDSSKFGKHALLTYADLNKVDAIITDNTKCKYKGMLRAEGVTVI